MVEDVFLIIEPLHLVGAKCPSIPRSSFPCNLRSSFPCKVTDALPTAHSLREFVRFPTHTKLSKKSAWSESPEALERSEAPALFAPLFQPLIRFGYRAAGWRVRQ
jgi:hypothetical protein